MVSTGINGISVSQCANIPVGNPPHNLYAYGGIPKSGIAYTSANGSYSFSKVWWETNSPEYGKDADKADVYLLFYNENYGLTKSDSSVTLYSESTSQIKTAELTSIVDTYTYNIDLRDDSDSSSLTDGIEFHYSYTDYRGVERSGNINAVGTYSIPVVYYKGESVPQITLSNFESVNKEVNTSSKESVEQFSFKDEVHPRVRPIACILLRTGSG